MNKAKLWWFRLVYMPAILVFAFIAFVLGTLIDSIGDAYHSFIDRWEYNWRKWCYEARWSFLVDRWKSGPPEKAK